MGSSLATTKATTQHGIAPPRNVIRHHSKLALLLQRQVILAASRPPDSKQDGCGPRYLHHEQRFVQRDDSQNER